MSTLSQKMKSYIPERQMINLNQSDYPHLRDTDLFRIMRHLPQCEVGGPWIAGGSVWRAVLNHPLENCDIDMFFANKKQFESSIRQMSGYPFVRNVLQETKNKWNTTYKIHVNQGTFNKTIDVQFINMSYHKNLDELLNSFDFTVCQFGWDGQNIVVNRTSISDLNDKKISIWRVGHPKSLFQHLVKYMDNGFTLSSTETKRLLSDVLYVNPWNTKNNIDYNEPLEKEEKEWGGHATLLRNTTRVVPEDPQWQHNAAPIRTYMTIGPAGIAGPEMVQPAPETFARPEPAQPVITNHFDEDDEWAGGDEVPLTTQEPARPMDLNANRPTTPTPTIQTEYVEPLWATLTTRVEIPDETRIRRETLERELTEVEAALQNRRNQGYENVTEFNTEFDRLFNTRRQTTPRRMTWEMPAARPPRGPGRFDEDRQNPNLRDAFDPPTNVEGLADAPNQTLNPLPTNNTNGQERR